MGISFIHYHRISYFLHTLKDCDFKRRKSIEGLLRIFRLFMRAKQDRAPPKNWHLCVFPISNGDFTFNWELRIKMRWVCFWEWCDWMQCGNSLWLLLAFICWRRLEIVRQDYIQLKPKNVWVEFRQFVRNDNMALLDKTQVAWSQFPKPTVAIKSRRPQSFSVLLTFSSTSFVQEFILNIITNSMKCEQSVSVEI